MDDCICACDKCYSGNDCSLVKNCKEETNGVSCIKGYEAVGVCGSC